MDLLDEKDKDTSRSGGQNLGAQEADEETEEEEEGDDGEEDSEEDDEDFGGYIPSAIARTPTGASKPPK